MKGNMVICLGGRDEESPGADVSRSHLLSRPEKVGARNRVYDFRELESRLVVHHGYDRDVILVN
jgi:hypothetical protein